jgi:hypothetical protein
MALPPIRTVGAFVLTIAVAATVWFFATNRHMLRQTLPPPLSEVVRTDAVVVPLRQPVAAIREGGPTSVPPRSIEERAAAVKHTATLIMGRQRDHVVEQLVEHGLSREDAERMGQRAVEGYADCLFEAVRKQYEAQGNLGEFLDHSEIAWVEAAISLSSVRTAMAPCLANIGQQVGIPSPASLASGGSLDERITLPPEPPSWAAEMERRIRDHVASRPELGVTDVVVECREQGCSALLVGREIRIFDFEFDVFAEQNGFQRAMVGGDRNGRSVWLER